MNVIDSNLYKEVIETHKFSVGNFYIFENTVIAEINEGMHVNLESAQDGIKAIYNYFGTNKPFGYLSNRINNYSLDALDYKKHHALFPNLLLYGAICYSGNNRMNLDLEKQFCKVPFLGFKNITEAYNYVNKYILDKTTEIA